MIRIGLRNRILFAATLLSGACALATGCARSESGSISSTRDQAVDEDGFCRSSFIDSYNDVIAARNKAYARPDIQDALEKAKDAYTRYHGITCTASMRSQEGYTYSTRTVSIDANEVFGRVAAEMSRALDGALDVCPDSLKVRTQQTLDSLKSMSHYSQLAPARRAVSSIITEFAGVRCVYETTEYESGSVVHHVYRLNVNEDFPPILARLDSALREDNSDTAAAIGAVVNSENAAHELDARLPLSLLERP